MAKSLREVSRRDVEIRGEVYRAVSDRRRRSLRRNGVSKKRCA